MSSAVLKHPLEADVFIFIWKNIKIELKLEQHAEILIMFFIYK